MTTRANKDLEPGTRVTVIATGPLGAFDLSCWTATDGRLTNRVFFAQDFDVFAGMSGTVQGRDHTTEDDWYVIAFGDYVAPLHRSMFQPEETL